MSLPTMIIFERHWDEPPKQLVKHLIPRLEAEGYNTYCLEAPQNLSDEEITERFYHCLKEDRSIFSQAEHLIKQAGVPLRGRLSDVSFGDLMHLMQLFVSSQRYSEVAEKIKGFPASLIFKDIVEALNRRHFSIKGADIDSEVYDQIITSSLLTDRMSKVRLNDEARIEAFFDNLVRLRSQNKGVVFSCGALHAEKLIALFKKKGLLNDIVYCFPHSSKRYDQSIDDVSELKKWPVFKEHTHTIKNLDEVKDLAKKLLSEIQAKNVHYITKIEQNTHIERLNRHFSVKFIAACRPGHYVDALLSEESYPEIAGKLQKSGVEIRYVVFQKLRYLAIQGVNTAAVAKKIIAL